MKLKFNSPFLWLVFILAILVFGFAYSIMMEPLGITYNLFYNDSDLDHSDYQNFYIRSKTIWLWMPFVVVISLLLWTMLKVHQQWDVGGGVE